MDKEAAARAAAMLVDARRNRQPIDALPEDCRPRNLADAYAIQDAHVPMLLAYAGGNAVGYKAGATAEAPQKNLGLEGPFRGVLLSPYLLASGATVPADACFHRIVETEFAFRMAEDLPPAAAPYDPDGVRASVGSLIISIELVDVRFKAGMAAGGFNLIADNGGGGHWVQGAEFSDFANIDLDDFPVSLMVNGEVAQRGSSANVLGNPLHSLTWLANDLCMAGKGLKAGDLVTAGSCTTPHPVKAGDTAEADFGELGVVAVTFGA